MSIRIKPGETLSWSVIDDTGDLTGTTITSALKFNDYYYALTVTEDDLTIGSYTINAASTATIPAGRIECDIIYSIGGNVTASDTFSIYGDRQVTRQVTG